MAGHDRKEGLLEKARRIHIESRAKAAEFMSGAFRSAFKGTGLEFHDVRPYHAGDAVEHIDWNVTARTSELHVKTFVEEREQCVLFLVDTSASTAFGTGMASKSETMAELCALLGYSALANHDRVGMMLFSDDMEQYIPPKKGMDHCRLLIHSLLSLEPRQRGTSIENALHQLMRLRQRRAVVFLVSDFLDAGYEEAFGMAAKQHDLIAVRIWDRAEQALRGNGIACVHDLETRQATAVDLGSPQGRDDFIRSNTQRRQQLEAICASRCVDLVEVECGKEYLATLRTFFEHRIRRRFL